VNSLKEIALFFMSRRHKTLLKKNGRFVDFALTIFEIQRFVYAAERAPISLSNVPPTGDESRSSSASLHAPRPGRLPALGHHEDGHHENGQAAEGTARAFARYARSHPGAARSA